MSLLLPNIDQTDGLFFGPSYLPEDFSSSSSLEEDGKVLIAKFGRKISCGLFGIGDDFIEKYQSLDSRFVKNKAATFFFEAVGDSMAPTICPGDILIVDRSLTEFNGKVCIVSYGDELICKRVRLVNRLVNSSARSGVTLLSDNTKYSPIHVYDENLVSIWGVVVARAGAIK